MKVLVIAAALIGLIGFAASSRTLDEITTKSEKMDVISSSCLKGCESGDQKCELLCKLNRSCDKCFLLIDKCVALVAGIYKPLCIESRKSLCKNCHEYREKFGSDFTENERDYYSERFGSAIQRELKERYWQ